VGGGERAARVSEELRVHSEWDYRVLGFVDSSVAETPEQSEKILGRISDLEDILMREVVDEVIVALSIKSHYSAIERVIAVCERVGVQVQYCEDLFDVSWCAKITVIGSRGYWISQGPCLGSFFACRYSSS
jgi:FlaA1/EpsC-like NDP-sugar epimerase